LDTILGVMQCNIMQWLNFYSAWGPHYLLFTWYFVDWYY